jgi:hypothetical protein
MECRNEVNEGNSGFQETGRVAAPPPRRPRFFFHGRTTLVCHGVNFNFDGKGGE